MLKRRTFFQQKQAINTTVFIQRTEKTLPRDTFETVKDQSKLSTIAIRVNLDGSSAMRFSPVSGFCRLKVRHECARERYSFQGHRWPII